MAKNTITLDEFIEKEYGKKGTPKREKFEKGYEKFKVEQKRLFISTAGKPIKT